MHTVITPEEKLVLETVEMNQQELNIMRKLAWQKQIKINVKQKTDGNVMFTAPLVFLALSGFLD